MRSLIILSLLAAMALPALSQTPGGMSDAPLDSDGVKAAALFCMDQLNVNSTTPYSLVSIQNAQSQVVSGTRYVLTLTCQEGYDWPPMKMLVVTCSMVNQSWMTPPSTLQSISKDYNAVIAPLPSTPTTSMPGGFSQGNASAPEVKSAIQFCIKQLAANKPDHTASLSNAPVLPYSLHTVTSVQQQVVSGMNYNLVFQVTDKMSNAYDVTCKVWSQPWLPTPNKLTGLTVVDATSAHTGSTGGTVVGGKTAVAPCDENVQQAAQYCLQQLNTDAAIRLRMLGEFGTQPGTPAAHLMKVLDAEQQVVSGTIYSLGLQMSFLGRSFTVDCSVWSQPWLQDPLKIQSLACRQYN